MTTEIGLSITITALRKCSLRILKSKNSSKAKGAIRRMFNEANKKIAKEMKRHYKDFIGRQRKVHLLFISATQRQQFDAARKSEVIL